MFYFIVCNCSSSVGRCSDDVSMLPKLREFNVKERNKSERREIEKLRELCCDEQ